VGGLLVGVLQCGVAVCCCSVLLQRVTMCDLSGVLGGDVVYLVGVGGLLVGVLQCGAAVCGSVAVCCSVLQCVAVRCRCIV